MAIISAGGMDLYYHSEPPITKWQYALSQASLGRAEGGENFYWAGPRLRTASALFSCLLSSAIKYL